MVCVSLQGNYVPDSDAVVMSQCAEYDVIVCLNVTRWVHLNWGDIGLQRLFRRIYTHLHPGGLFILQPQPWSSYSKRKRLTVNVCVCWGAFLHHVYDAYTNQTVFTVSKLNAVNTLTKPILNPD